MAEPRAALTVAMATHNGADRVVAAIDRVLSQSFADLELLVVDDGSTDATGERVRSIRDHRLRYVHRENGGLSAARNTGIHHASAPYVVFLDDDDLPHPDWLEGLHGALAPGVAVVTCGCRYVDVDGVEQRILLPARPWDGRRARTGADGIYLAGTFAVRRDLLRGVGGFAEALPISHQTELMWRLLPEVERRGDMVAAVHRPLIDIVRRPAGDRSRMDPVKLQVGTEYFLEHHGERLAASPQQHADYLAVAGVAAARLGDLRRARTRFWAAVRARPLGWRNGGRFLVACVPPVAARVWGRPTP